MKQVLLGCGMAMIALPVVAAVHVDLDKQPASLLVRHGLVDTRSSFVEQKRSVDLNKTLHVRLQQTYQDYPVYGANAVLHVPSEGASTKHFQTLVSRSASINGDAFQGLANDLTLQPSVVFTEEREQSAIAFVTKQYQARQAVSSLIDLQSIKPMIYIDSNNTAHWAYEIKMVTTSAQQKKAMPAFIIDAVNSTVYQEWNDLKNAAVKAGGFGGNHKTGQKIMDGGLNHFPALIVDRDTRKKICYMRNDNVNIVDDRTNKPMSFGCKVTDPQHNNVYWNGSHDQVATTWSPSNDVMFGSVLTQKLFNDWYHIPVLVKNGKPMRLTASVHLADENAYWDGQQVIFGDSLGSDYFNPFAQLDTVAHEICHGFTEQNSDLAYYGQSGGLNEAFSDMAGIAAEYYAYGKTEFLVGVGDVKEEGKALRYMDQPSKDCYGNQPGNGCSIDHMSQYNDGINVHYSSGIFNRVYYTLAHIDGWNARKAFDVMVQANQHYWTSNTSFAKAACGVKRAAQDYQYDVAAVAQAFNIVGIDIAQCAS